MRKWIGGVAAAVSMLFATSVFSAAAFAQQVEEETASDADAERMAAAQAFIDSLQFKTGDFHVAAADATLHVGQGFRYLEATDARRVLEEFWGNPEDTDTLGLVVPASPSLLEDGSWAVVVSYSDDGYVSDEDASDVDYDDLLADMKSDTHDKNEARSEAGYPTVEVVGWAAPPRYDNTSKKIYWARELAFEGETDHTLNYDIRVLGREGYLSLSAIADMSELPAVQEGMQRVLAFTEFDAGQRYADHNPSTDKVAAYGLAALVGGTLAAKAGLFAKLGVLLLAFKKLLIPVVLVIGAAFSKFFKKKGATPPPPPPV